MEEESEKISCFEVKLSVKFFGRKNLDLDTD